MIIDKLVNSAIYENLNPRFAKAFEYIINNDLGAMEPGKYEIDGQEIFMMLSLTDLKTRDNAPLEVHDKYIDIQYVIEGEETFGWLERSECKEPRGKMDTDKDILFYEDSASTFCTLKAGEFCIFFPTDGHAPMIGNPSTQIKKCIIKVKK